MNLYRAEVKCCQYCGVALLKVRILNLKLCSYSHLTFSRKHDGSMVGFANDRISGSCRFFSGILRDKITISSERPSADVPVFERNDFVGVPASTSKAAAPAVDVAIANLVLQLTKNFRVKSENFIQCVLQRLNADDASLVEMLCRSADRYVPNLINMCGHAMSDISNVDKRLILDQFWRSLVKKGVPISIDSYNAFLKTMVENESDFDVWNALEELETKFHLVPNQTTFAALLSHLAVLNDPSLIEKLASEAAKRSVPLRLQSDLFLIQCHAANGNYTMADSLMQEILTEHGNKHRAACLDAYIKGAAIHQDLAVVEKIMDEAVEPIVFEDGTKKRVLCFPYDSVFEILWLLAKFSTSGEGREHEALYAKIFDRTERKTGFFKYLVREVERHILHSRYFSALAITGEMLRVGDCFRTQQRTQFLTEVIARFAYRMVLEKEETAKMKVVLKHFKKIFGERIRYADFFLYAVLTCKHLSLEEKQQYFENLIDQVDMPRQRIHLVLPLLTCAPNVTDRLLVVQNCVRLGYNNFSALDIRMLSRLLLSPLYAKARNEQEENSSRPYLDFVSQLMQECGIEATSVWKILLEWLNLKQSSSDSYGILASEAELKSWLKDQYQILFKQKPPVKKNANLHFVEILDCLENKNAAQAAELLEKNGINFDVPNKAEIVSRLIHLFLSCNDFSTVMKFLRIVSASEDDIVSLLQNYHLIQLLTKKMASVGKLDESVTEAACELRRLFPTTVYRYDNLRLTSAAIKDMVVSYFAIVPLVDSDGITDLLKFLRILKNLKFFELNREEIITDFIVRRVSQLQDWNAALVTWLKCKTVLDSLNAIVRLLRYFHRRQQRDIVDFIIHKAQNFASNSEINAIQAAVFVELNMIGKAAKIMETGNLLPADVVWSIRLVNTLSFEKNAKFNLEFVKLCLRFVNFKTDDVVRHSFQSEIFGVCEQLGAGDLALQFYSLFKEHDYGMNLEELERISNLVTCDEQCFSKWISAPDGLISVEDTASAPLIEKTRKELFDELDAAKRAKTNLGAV